MRFINLICVLLLHACSFRNVFERVYIQFYNAMFYREKAFRELVPPQWAQMNGEQFDPVRAPEPDDHTGDSDAGEYPVCSPLVCL